jgi:predicted nucleic-acid-binding Zn-ribbon protein
MTDKTNLSTEDFERFQQWLKSRVPYPLKCPACNANDWIAGGIGVNPILKKCEGELTQVPGHGFTSIPLSCKNCAETKFYSTKIIGIT